MFAILPKTCVAEQTSIVISIGTINCCSSCDTCWLEAPCLELSGLVGACWDLLWLVGSCWEVVKTCQELLGGIGNVDFMESHFEGITIVVNKFLAESPIPKILWSVPGIGLQYCTQMQWNAMSELTWDTPQNLGNLSFWQEKN